MRFSRRRKAVLIGLLVLVLVMLIVALTWFLVAPLLCIQLDSRDMIRRCESEVSYCSFNVIANEMQKVHSEDQFFFLGRNGGWLSPRNPRRGYDDFFSWRMYPAVTSNVYVVVDDACPRDKSERDINRLPYMCYASNVTVFVVGAMAGTPAVKVCEPWAGSWSGMKFAGRKVDCSVIDSLFYVIHYEEHALLEWIALEWGIKKADCVWEASLGWDGFLLRESYTNALYKVSHTID